MAAGLWGIALASSFCFGLALVLTQFGLRHLDAIRGAAVSIPVSTVLCWAGILFFFDLGGWHGGAAATFAAVGLFFPAAVTILTFEANRRMGPAVAGAIGNLAPLFAVLLAVGLLGEALTLPKGLGIAGIVIGVTLIGIRRNVGLGGGWPLWALALPLSAALVRGAVQPAVKIGLADWNSPLAAVGIGYAVSSVVVIAIAVARSGLRNLLPDIRGAAWFAGVGVCNVAAVFTLYASLARGPVTVVAPLVASYPLVTLVLGWFLLRHDRPGVPVLLGIAITVGGIAALLAGA